MRFPYKAKSFSNVQKMFDFLGGNINREVVGEVSATTPTIVAGKGFTLSKTGTGDVTVTFTKPFSVMVATVSVKAGLGRAVQIHPLSTNAALRVLTSNAGAASDEIFSFIAKEAGG